MPRQDPFWRFFWISILATASLSTIIVLLLNLPIVLVPVGIALISTIFLIPRPLALLSFLILVRMSLDISTNTVFIPLWKDFSISLSQALGIEVTAIVSLALFLYRRWWKTVPLTMPLVLVLTWGFLSMIFSIDSAGTARELLRVFDLLLLFMLSFFATQSRSNLKQILIVFFISSIIPIAAGIYQFIFHIGFQDESVSIPRIYGTFSHPNIFSLYLFSLIVLSSLFFSSFAKTPKEKLAALSIMSGYMTMLLLTYTRVAWVILFVFFFLLTLFRFRKLLLPLIFVPLLLFLAIAPFQDRLIDSFHFSPDSSIAWRLNIWKDGLVTTIRNGRVFFGSGMNTFPEVLENIRGLSQGPSNDPHNDFVKFFVEGGIIGFFVFVVYLTLITQELLRRFNVSRDPESKTTFLILFAFFISLAIASLSDNIFKDTPVQWIFWITLGSVLKVFTSNQLPRKKEKPATPALQK